ncbi:5'-nucleotidase C-terminal domain-containing protein [Flavobacteriaceae bacterium]|nr:5'-nucleotidase C-terminal domain-containing protein [Flavobacteriaceae bacterium]
MRLFTFLLIGILGLSSLGAQETVVIYAINDPHGQINNFPRLKTLIENDRAQNSKVFFVSAGDLFSGNPIVDYHESKGFPMIDLLNGCGLDVSVIGNHEFDYGQDVLNARIEQAEFPFICDNVSNVSGVLADVNGFELITKDDFTIAFVGVVETGSPGLHPLTHPKKIEGLTFTEGLDSFPNYEDLKADNDADLLVALTHYGSYKDRKILETYSFVDLVIGGHTNGEYGEAYENGYMVMSGKNLEKVSKTTLTVTNKAITDFNFELIDLSSTSMAFDQPTQSKVDDYNNQPEFYTVIGESEIDHTKSETACLYTDALQSITGADFVIQNMGGIRTYLDEGDITPFDIYSIDPFGNSLDTFEMTITDFRTFLNNYQSSYSYSTTLKINKDENQVLQFSKDGVALEDTDVIEFSLNDYISNVLGDYFPEPSFTYKETTADYIIEYIRDIHQGAINYENCSQRESTLSTTQKRAVLKLHLQNPVGEFITFGTELLGALSLYDIYGKLVLSTEDEPQTYVGFLSPGVYFVQLYIGTDTYSGKLLKN